MYNIVSTKNNKIFALEIYKAKSHNTNYSRKF